MSTSLERVTTREGQIESSTVARPRASAEGLLRQLIECVGRESFRVPAAPTDPDASEILLEMTVGEMRYVLTRRRILLPRMTSQGVLSPREKEIVRLVARGLPSKAIAGVLDVSLWTVGTHLRRIFAKLGVNSRAEMVAQALRENLIGTSMY